MRRRRHGLLHKSPDNFIGVALKHRNAGEDPNRGSPVVLGSNREIKAPSELSWLRRHAPQVHLVYFRETQKARYKWTSDSHMSQSKQLSNICPMVARRRPGKESHLRICASLDDDQSPEFCLYPLLESPASSGIPGPILINHPGSTSVGIRSVPDFNLLDFLGMIQPAAPRCSIVPYFVSPSLGAEATHA